MSDSTATMSIHESVERMLAERISNEPGFIAELLLDPRPIVLPLLVAAGGDAADYDGVAMNVHIETPQALHFVVPVFPLEDEVEGFSISLPNYGWGGPSRGNCDLNPMSPARNPPTGRPVEPTAAEHTKHPALCEPTFGP